MPLMGSAAPCLCFRGPYHVEGKVKRPPLGMRPLGVDSPQSEGVESAEVSMAPPVCAVNSG